MTHICRICLTELPEEGNHYHPKCLRELFGTSRQPSIAIDHTKLVEQARAMVGFVSLSGVQQKLSLRLTSNKKSLEVSNSGLQYILKPQVSTYPHLPENEALAMRIARLAGIEVPPCGLIELSDGSLAYISKRFDRGPNGEKFRMEDFCQLAELPPKEKYQGSFEQCAKIVKKYATAPIVQLSKLFKQVTFSWWIGNEDLHRKNLSLLVTTGGDVVLSPAYDIVSSRLHFRERELALKLNGKDKKITLSDWQYFATQCDLKSQVSTKVLEGLVKLTGPACDLIGASILPEDQKQELKELVHQNSRSLEEA